MVLNFYSIIIILKNFGWLFLLSNTNYGKSLDARDQGSVTLLIKMEIFAWRGKQFEGSLRSETVSPILKKAIISVEDKGFYNHFGISIRGILGAIAINLKEGRGPSSDMVVLINNSTSSEIIMLTVTK